MVWLKNVNRENNIIYADYFPEDSFESSLIEYHIITDEFKGNMVGYEMETRSHLNHALYALKEMSKGERPIKDTLIMWY